MNDQGLEELLRRADSALGPPSPPEDLPGRVRRLRRRRRNARLGLGLAAAGVLCALGLAVCQWAGKWWTIGPAGENIARQGPPAPSVPTEGREEFARLGAEADARAAAITDLLARQDLQKRLAAAQRRLAELEAVDPLQRHLDRAAEILLKQADRAENELALRACAADLYRRVIDRFPDSPWAVYARKRLNEIQPTTGETL